VLLQLMKAFKLLRPPPLAELAEAETFLVPAVLPRSELPPEYTEPQWWCPSKASGAAVMRVDHSARRAVSLAIGAFAGQQGPLECVVLNACSTLKMGRLLRQRGVPNQMCWQTPVRDETARELCERFFRPLVEDKQAGKQDYKGALKAAMNFMRPLSRTHGAKDLPHTVGESASVGARGGQHGFVKPWEEEDVVLFLSNDGDSKPIYPWRKRPVVSASLTASADAGHTVTANETVDAGLKQVLSSMG
jgi:hypothetical protein